MTCGEPVRSCATRAVASLSRFNSCWAVQTTERYRGCKQNLGHPVNDLFDLGKDVQTEQANFPSAAVKPSTPLGMASRQGLECRHGGSDHDQPVCDTRALFLPERTDLIEVRKGHRSHSLRRCSEAGTSGGNAGSKADSQSDPRTRGPVGVGILPDPTS